MVKINYREISVDLDRHLPIIDDPRFQLHTEWGSQILETGARGTGRELAFTLASAGGEPLQRMAYWYDYFSRIDIDQIKGLDSPVIRYLLSLGVLSRAPQSLLPQGSAGMYPEMIGAGAGMASHESALSIDNSPRRIVLGSSIPPQIQAMFYHVIAASRLENSRQFRQLLSELDEMEGGGGLLTPVFLCKLLQRVEITAGHIQAVAARDPKTQMYFADMLVEHWYSALKTDASIEDAVSVFSHLCVEAQRRIAIFLRDQGDIVSGNNKVRAFVARILHPRPRIIR